MYKRLVVHDSVEVLPLSPRQKRKALRWAKKRFPVGWGWTPHKHRRKRLAKKLQRRGNIRVIAKGPPDKRWVRRKAKAMTAKFGSATGLWSERLPPPIHNFPRYK